jgi:hypothetical protein
MLGAKAAPLSKRQTELIRRLASASRHLKSSLTAEFGEYTP